MLIAQTTQTTTNVADFVLPLIPWIVVFIFVWFVVLRMRRGQNAHMRRAREHWEAVEKKLDRLIDIAERRDKGG
jgi:flagellar biosynthesis/type III secretory pathway M-ring protein FliF/YscJ